MKNNNSQPFQTVIGKLKLKRTIIPNAAVQKIYFIPERYFKLVTVSQFMGITTDELIRIICDEYIDSNDGIENPQN